MSLPNPIPSGNDAHDTANNILVDFGAESPCDLLGDSGGKSYPRYWVRFGVFLLSALSRSPVRGSQLSSKVARVLSTSCSGYWSRAVTEE